MNYLYFLQNRLLTPIRGRLIDCYVPISFFQTKISLYNGEYVRFISNNDLTEIDFDRATGQIISVDVVFSKKIIPVNSKLELNYLHLKQTSALNFKNNDDTPNTGGDVIPRYDMPVACTVYLYFDAVVIVLPHISVPKFYIYENESFGVLIDKDLHIIAFVLRGLSNDEHNIVFDYMKRQQEQEILSEAIFFKESYIMENKEQLIQKIIELKNINYWRLLYYGLERKLIDSAFCVDFAEEALDKKRIEDSLVIELAGLLKNQIEEVPRLLEAAIKDKNKILIDEGPFYNKIWFYLTLAADIQASNIIE